MTMTHKEAEATVDQIEELVKACVFLARTPVAHPNRQSAEEMLRRAREALVEALRVS